MAIMHNIFSKLARTAALLMLAFSAVVPTADAAVCVPGLAQAKFTGSSTDKTSAIASSSTLAYAAGPIMANTSGSAKDWNGTSWAWGNNTVFGYLGEMWMEAGTTYTFGKSIDDWTYVVVNGTTIIENSTYNAITFGSYTATETGWVPIEIRVGNGSGGAGLANGAKYGVAYNTVTNTVQNDFKAATNGWAALLDPGDCSILRVAYPRPDYMTIGDVVVDGGDLVVTASFSGLVGTGTFTAFYGTADGGTVSNDWDYCVMVTAVAAGDTAAAQYRLVGAGSAAFVAFRLSAMAGTSTPVRQWSDTYALGLPSPVFKLVSTDVGYTNLTFAASCLGLGQGASSVDIDVQLATDDAFASTVQTKSLALAGLGSEAVTFIDLATNTVYYARVVGMNDQNEGAASSTVSETTLEPGFAAGVASFAGCGFTMLSAAAIVSDFGGGSDSAEIRLEASTDSAFSAIASVSTEVAMTLDGAMTLSCENLAPDTAYYLRFRLVNEWGLVSYVPIAGTIVTRSVPISATGIGYAFSADGSTVDISFGVSEVFAGASCSATLQYSGRTYATKGFYSSGVLVWEQVPSARETATAIVTVTAAVDGTTYTHEWTVTVTPGTAAHVVASLPDLANVVFRVGDSAVLPELAKSGDYYLPLDVRVFSIDGTTLTALEPGFSAVCVIEREDGTGAFVRNATMGLAICIPEAEGRVFVAEAGGMNMVRQAKHDTTSEMKGVHSD